jgi:hypothetical protein
MTDVCKRIASTGGGMIPDRGGSFGYKLLHLIIDLLQNSARLEVTNENRGRVCVRAEPRSWWR